MAIPPRRQLAKDRKTVRFHDISQTGDIKSFSADITYRSEAYSPDNSRIGIRIVDLDVQTRTGDRVGNGGLNNSKYIEFKSKAANRLRDRLTMSRTISNISTSNIKAPLGFPTEGNANSQISSFATSAFIARPGSNDPWRVLLKGADQTPDVPVHLADINLDGKTDVGRGRPDAFRVYFTASNYGDLSKADFTVTGISSTAMTGTTGDFNADGKVDLAVSRKPDDKSDGRVGIFYSITEKVNLGTRSLSFDQADVIFVGETVGDGFGSLSAPKVDLNRDGSNDLIIGAPLASSLAGTPAVGRLYQFYGRPASTTVPLNFVDISTTSVPGSGDFLADTGTGLYTFTNNGAPYQLSIVPTLGQVQFDYYEKDNLQSVNELVGPPKKSGTQSDFSLAARGRQDDFGFVFKAPLTIPVSGDYTFETTSDDGSVLKIDGQVVVNNDGRHGSQTRSATVNLTAGVHQVEVRYFEYKGGESLNVKIAAPNEHWFCFRTLGDGLADNSLRAIPASLGLDATSKLRIDLRSSTGQTLRTGAGAMSLRGIEAGTYYARVYTADGSTAKQEVPIFEPLIWLPSPISTRAIAVSRTSPELSI